MRYLILLILFAIIAPGSMEAGNTKDVLLNEILIDPAPQTIEIINTGSESADISNWYLDDSGGTTYFTIPLNTIMYPHSCVLFSSDFNLNKSSSDIARLFDNAAPPTSSNSSLIDSYSYKSSPGTGISFVRIPDGSSSWASSSVSLGLFNETKQSCIILPTPTTIPSLTPTPTSQPTPTSAPTSIPTPTVIPSPTPTPNLPTPTMPPYTNIFLSEVMSYPSSGEHEWVELYNNNDFSVSLVNWYLDDTENAGSTPQAFSFDIPFHSYAIIELSSSVFNNDGDSIRLLDTEKNIKDSFEYGSSTQGKSWGRQSWENDMFCIQQPTRNVSNNPCETNVSTPTKKPTPNTPLLKSATKAVIFTDKNLSVSSSVQHFSIQPVTSSYQIPPSVLGVKTEKLQKTSRTSQKVIKLFSFLSCFYSLLGVSSCVARMGKIV